MHKVLAASLLLASLNAAEPTRPNVLLICVDDLKPTLACAGDVHAKTPNIDRLAARGVLFHRSYVQQAVCSPSRLSLMTGLRPDQLGIYDLSTKMRDVVPDVVTLPQAFIAAGYHAEAMGKIYHQGHGNGDDRASWSVPHVSSGPDPKVAPDGPDMPEGTQERERKASDKSRGPAWGWPDLPDHKFPDGRTADRAVERIQALSAGDKPFFLGVGFVKPHLPFIAPPRCWDRYDPATLPVEAVDAPIPDSAPTWAGNVNFGELRAYDRIQGEGRLTADQARTMVHGYYACVSFLDEQVGKVLDALDASPAADNTIIILWGDHGWHLGDHGWWCKHTNYEQAARNPLIIAAPGLSAGTPSTSLASTIDLYPTLLELAGLPGRPDLSGKSLVPILTDPAASVQDAVMHCYPRGVDGQASLGRAVRTDRWRYVSWERFDEARTTVAEELYDLDQDPKETVNLAGRAEVAAIQADLARRIAALPAARPQFRTEAAAK